MLARNVVQLLVAQNPKVVADQPPSVLRFYDVIDEASLRRNERICESAGVFGSVFFQVLSQLLAALCLSRASPSVRRLTFPLNRISTAPLAPITATSAPGQA